MRPFGDFDLILGVDFFVKAKMALVPHLGGLMFFEESLSCFVQAVVRRVNNRNCCMLFN